MITHCIRGVIDVVLVLLTHLIGMYDVWYKYSTYIVLIIIIHMCMHHM